MSAHLRWVPGCFRTAVDEKGRVAFEAERGDGHLVSVYPDEQDGLYIATIDRVVSPHRMDCVDSSVPLPLPRALDWAERAVSPAVARVAQ